MNKVVRNRRIKTLHQGGVSIKKLATKTSLSEERIRQILREKDVKKFFDDLKTYYKHILTNADSEWIKKEVKFLSKHDRKKETVIRRRELVRYLHMELNVPFYRIGLLLKRHHTSIMNLFYGIN